MRKCCWLEVGYSWGCHFGSILSLFLLSNEGGRDSGCYEGGDSPSDYGVLRCKHWNRCCFCLRLEPLLKFWSFLPYSGWSSPNPPCTCSSPSAFFPSPSSPLHEVNMIFSDNFIATSLSPLYHEHSSKPFRWATYRVPPYNFSYPSAT